MIRDDSKILTLDNDEAKSIMYFYTSSGKLIHQFQVTIINNNINIYILLKEIYYLLLFFVNWKCYFIIIYLYFY